MRCDWKGSSEGLWHALGRLRVGLGACLSLLALVSLPHGKPLLLALFGFFTAGFVAANATGLACRTEHRRLVELASTAFGGGAAGQAHAACPA